MEARKAKISRWILLFVTAALSLLLVACGGSSSGPSGGTQSQNDNVTVMVQDASTEDWAMIGVKVLSVSLTPQGGGTPVTVFTASSPAPMINLVQLDQLGDILGSAQVPAGTYTGATLTIGGNPGDVVLTASADPETGFAGTPGATIPSSQIQIIRNAGYGGQPHCAGESEVRYTAGGHRQPELTARCGLRPGASGIHRGTRTRYSWANHVGGELPRSGASPSYPQPRVARVAAHVRTRDHGGFHLDLDQ